MSASLIVPPESTISPAVVMVGMGKTPYLDHTIKHIDHFQRVAPVTESGITRRFVISNMASNADTMIDWQNLYIKTKVTITGNTLDAIGSLTTADGVFTPFYNWRFFINNSTQPIEKVADNQIFPIKMITETAGSYQQSMGPPTGYYLDYSSPIDFTCKAVNILDKSTFTGYNKSRIESNKFWVTYVNGAQTTYTRELLIKMPDVFNNIRNLASDLLPVDSIEIWFDVADHEAKDNLFLHASADLNLDWKIEPNSTYLIYNMLTITEEMLMSSDVRGQKTPTKLYRYIKGEPGFEYYSSFVKYKIEKWAPSTSYHIPITVSAPLALYVFSEPTEDYNACHYHHDPLSVVNENIKIDNVEMFDNSVPYDFSANSGHAIENILDTLITDDDKSKGLPVPLITLLKTYPTLMYRLTKSRPIQGMLFPSSEIEVKHIDYNLTVSVAPVNELIVITACECMAKITRTGKPIVIFNSNI